MRVTLYRVHEVKKKAAWDRGTVCEYLRNRAGIQFDMEIIAVLLNHVDEIMTLYEQ